MLLRVRATAQMQTGCYEGQKTMEIKYAREVARHAIHIYPEQGTRIQVHYNYAP